MSENRRVVVTGVGAISPLGHSAQATWQAMKAGVNGIGPITAIDTGEYKAKLAAEVRDFDPLNYFSKNDVLRADRNAQFAVAATEEAIRDSGILGTVEPERFAVRFGTGIGGIATFEAEHRKLLERGPRRVSPLFVPMIIDNMAAGLLAIRFDCRGSALPAVTACASGGDAIGEGLRLIRHGYADAVIAGGTEAAITPSALAGFANMQALSQATDPEAASLPFDRRRSGFIIAEGAVSLILEDYERAVARGARIYGEPVGYGSTCDAYHITSPHPDAVGGAAAMRDAMREAGYRPGESVYINAHGTGTRLNDVGETRAIKTALGAAAYDALISSTKSMTGHMLGAAGAVEAMACLFALNEGIVPPTINLDEPDPECDLNYVPHQAVAADIDLALSNSLGFGGHNVCLAFRRAE